MPNSKASLFPFSCNLTILDLLYTFSPSLLPPPLPPIPPGSVMEQKSTPHKRTQIGSAA